jgi:hypothetical protein
MALISTFTFGGMDNTSDPASVGAPEERGRAYTRCIDLVNCDVDDDLNVTRREGGEVLAEGEVTSAWGGYCVVEQTLRRFVDGELVNISNSPFLTGPVEFCAVNDIVVFSDNATIGYLKDFIPYTVNSPAEDNDLLDLETWVKLTYPADKEHDESNFEIDAFKLATLAGRCLEFFNGALYLARDNFLYCTRTFNIAHMDIRYNVVAGFKDPITMVRAVSDGLYVGTEGGTYFLAGDGVKGSGTGVKGFTQRKVLPFGVIYGSGVHIPAGKAPRGAGRAAVWTTTDGIYMGAEGGQVTDLTEGRVNIPASDSAAAVARNIDKFWHYVVCMDETTLVLNLKNAACSRYTNFHFVGFFEQAGTYYGAGADGVVRLTGETDPGSVPVVSSIALPVADFGSSQLKRCPDVLLHVRTGGDMALDLLVDEDEVATDIPFTAPYQIEGGVRRMRAVMPRGARGASWQFRITNPNGDRFTALSLKANPLELQRSI